MKQYSYAELIICCEHDPALAELQELMVEAALDVVLTGVRGSAQYDSLSRLAVAAERLNLHLEVTKAQGWFVAPDILQDHEALACWSCELVFGIYWQRKL